MLVWAANPEAMLELAADGQLIALTPTGGDTSAGNNAWAYRFGHWARRQGGWTVFASSGGFRLPDGSALHPDASVVREDRWQALTPEQRRGLAPLCSDLVIELASPSGAGSGGRVAVIDTETLSTGFRRQELRGRPTHPTPRGRLGDLHHP